MKHLNWFVTVRPSQTGSASFVSVWGALARCSRKLEGWFGAGPAGPDRRDQQDDEENSETDY